MSESDRSEPDIVSRLNRRFAAIAGWSYDHRWIVFAACLVSVGLAVWQAGKVRIDNSYEAYFDPADPIFLAYEQYREDFGSDEVSYILYEAPGYEHGPWNLEVMRKIVGLTTALEDEVPFVYEVKTLANAELIYGARDGIDISELADDFPETQEQLLALRARYLAEPMLVGGIVSEDALHAAIIIEMDRSSTDPLDEIQHDPEGGQGLENLYPQATDAVIEEILARPEYAGIEFYHSGDVPINAIYNRIIEEESEFLNGVSSLVIGVILLISFRSLIGSLAPIFVVQCCVIFCVALVSLLGWKLDMSFGGTPTLLTAIGIAHAVHILSEFRLRLAELGDRREALVQTIYLVGTPCLLTSLTTAAGFLSMSLAPIKSIMHQGVYASFGVLAAFALSITLLMALLAFSRKELAGIVAGIAAAYAAMVASGGDYTGAAIGAAIAILGPLLLLHPRLEFAANAITIGGAASKGGEVMKRALGTIAAFDVKYRRQLLAGFGLVFATSVAGMAQIDVDSNWLDDLSYDVPIKGITERVDEVMGGTTNIIYLFDAGVEDGIKDPAVLREMERVQQIGEENEWLVRKSYSIVDILKDLNQAFHGDDPAWFKIPETRELVAQYLVLYEMSGGEETEELVSSDYRRASVELRLRLAMTSETAKLVALIDEEVGLRPLEASTMELTGIGALWLKLLDYIVSSQVRSFSIAFVVIALMMITIFRSFSVGMISMIPNVMPVVLALGVMGWFAIPLDYSKISIAAVAIGIAVDDTIHLVLRYRHEFRKHGDYEVALREAMQDVGRALWITSCALVLGFLVFTLSVMDSKSLFGVLLATTIVAALIADFLLMPALVLTFRPFGPESGRAKADALQEAA